MNTFRPHENKEGHTESDNRDAHEAPNVGAVPGEVLKGLDAGLDAGEIAEILRETGEGESAGMPGAKAAQAYEPAMDLMKLRDRLLQNLPGAEILRKQIEKEIKHEIDYLHKKAMRMLRKPGKINYFEMNNILSKIRDLRGVLARLIKASAETLKALWLRYVHGIM